MQGRVYQSQMAPVYQQNRFRQNTNKFEEVINRSAAFTFNTGSFKKGKSSQRNQQVNTLTQVTKAQVLTKKTTSPFPKSPSKQNSLFNSTIKLRPKQPAQLEEDDHFEIDNFIMINKNDGASRSQIFREIDRISENIRRSQTPKKSYTKRVVKSYKNPPKPRQVVRSISPIRSKKPALPVIKPNRFGKRQVSRKNMKQVNVVKSHREIVQKIKPSQDMSEEKREVVQSQRSKCRFNIDLQMTREEQFRIYVTKKKRALVAEDLFYTSSQFRFGGSLKLWLVESENAFFANHREQETNYFVSKNRVVDSKNPNNANQDQSHQAHLVKSNKKQGICYFSF